MSTENDNAPAYPGLGYLAPSGLTKRELFAAMAMQGIASNPTAYIDWKNLVVIDATYFSVSEARALRDWLNKALPEEKP